ncbi:MAG: DUF3179 domain-containing (seleno)protein [Fuerstiella sp.]
MASAVTDIAVRLVLASACLAVSVCVQADEPSEKDLILIRPELYQPLTEPPCSYCSTQHRKGLIRDDDRVVAWIRGAHNGGAIPLRHFLAGPRVINDTYGLFFYDPDGGYVTAFRKDYGYSFHGWRKGVMIARGPDGSLWSALSGRCFAGPKQGQRLNRVPAMVTNWAYWLMLHPESTAYDLFEGQTYKTTDLPTVMSSQAQQTMGVVDPRFQPDTTVIGIETGGTATAWPLDPDVERACVNTQSGDQALVAFWYSPTRTAVAFGRKVDGQTLTFYADSVSPETAPFKDRETGTRWTLAGRAVDGPLRGKELPWVNSVQCRWYAWVAEYPETKVFREDAAK